MGEQRARLLIVDDRPLNVELLMEMLEGYAIQSALSGQEALDKLSEKPYPDLILLDVMMPGMDGYEVVRQIKRREEIRNIPVIMVTALDEKHAKLRSLEAGAEEFISKPIDLLELQVRVRNMLRLGQLSHQLSKQNEVLEQEVAKRTASLTAEISVRQQAEQKILDLYDRDPQTYLLNYGAFSQRIQAQFDSLPPPQTLLVSLIELSRLHMFTQTLGRRLRDQLIVQLAQRLQCSALGAHLLAHLEPGVFGVAQRLDGMSHDQTAIQTALASIIEQTLQTPFTLQDATVQVSVRVGMAFSNSQDTLAEEVIHRAEMALSWAGQHGAASAIQTYTAELGAQATSARNMRVEIERRIGSLTPRESEIANLIVNGHASKMIAYMLGTSVRTIDTHRARIMDKLQANTLADLVRMMLAPPGPT